jgi:hypothetical protein
MMYVHDIRSLRDEDLLERSGDLSRPRLLPMVKVQVSPSERMHAHAALFCPHRVSHAALPPSEGPCHDNDLTTSANQRRRIRGYDELRPAHELRWIAVNDQEDLQAPSP